MKDLMAMSRSSLASHRASISQWLNELDQSKDKGHLVEESDLDQLIDELETYQQALTIIGQVRTLADKLRREGEAAGAVGIVNIAYAQEIERALSADC